jgi:hypothetical protein
VTLSFDTISGCFQISQRDIINSIEREMSSDLREGFRAVGKLRCLTLYLVRCAYVYV